MSDSAKEQRGLAVALAGGGTGGHIQPGLHLLGHALAHPADVPLADVLWFQAGRAVEERAFRGFEERFPWPAERVALRLEPEGGGAPSKLDLLRRILPAALVARRALVRHRSDLLLGLGGYTCAPAVLAALSLRIPVALLEINVVPGRATSWLAPFAARVLHAWPPAQEDARHRFTGPPLAPEFAGAEFKGAAPAAESSASARRALGLPADGPLILVLGGSQGAQSLNSFCREHAQELCAEGASVLHQTGPGRLSEGAAASARYRPVEFLDDVHAALSAATLVLCRGGASTLAEVGALQLPAWVVPYPHHPDRHQERNAEQLGEGCRIVHEPQLDADFARELATHAGAAGAGLRDRMRAALRASVPSDAARRIWRELADISRGR